MTTVDYSKKMSLFASYDGCGFGVVKQRVVRSEKRVSFINPLCSVGLTLVHRQPKLAAMVFHLKPVEISFPDIYILVA